MAKHCETKTLIVLIIINKLDLVNISLKRFCRWKNKPDSANLWLGGVQEKVANYSFIRNKKYRALAVWMFYLDH